MPRELLPAESDRNGPREVYVTLRDLIALQYEAKGFSFLPKHAVQNILSGRHRSKLRGRGLEFEEVRAYVAGDDIRNIDWRVSARTGKPHSKVFTEEKERPVMLLVDQRPSMFFGSVKYMKSVIAAESAALAAWRTLDVGDRIGGIIIGSDDTEFISPKRDRRNVQQMLSILAERNQALNATNTESTCTLEDAIKKLDHHVSHDFLVVIISDFHDVNPGALQLMTRVRRHNDVIAVQVTDPLEHTLPKERIVLSEGQHQTLIARNDAVRSAFQISQNSQYEQLSEHLKAYGIPNLQFSTAAPAIHQLREVMGGIQKMKRQSR